MAVATQSVEKRPLVAYEEEEEEEEEEEKGGEEGTPSDEEYIIPQKRARLQNSGVGEYLQGFL